MSKLTPKQIRFIDEYLIDLNGAQAAIRTGYSEKTARTIASELLTKPDIKAEIDKRQIQTATKMQISKESLIADLLVIKELCINDPRVAHTSIKAIDTINKMLGYNEPTKTDITTNGKDIIPNINISIVKPKEDL